MRNHYSSHLQEILLTLQNEYTDWEDALQHPNSVRNQVKNIYNIILETRLLVPDFLNECQF